MEQQHRRPFRLAWVAIAIGMLAIGLVIGSAMGGARAMFMANGQAGPQRWSQHALDLQQAVPNMPAMPGARGGQGFDQGGPGGQGGFAQHDRMMMMREHGGMRGGIFGMIGGLIKLVFWGLAAYLIFLAARDRWGKNRGGTPPTPPAPGGDQTSSRPGPEQPPYTGMTTNL